MTIAGRERSTMFDARYNAARMLAVILFAGISATATAQQAAPSQDKATEKTAPPPEAQPTGDPRSGVLKPPNIDPKMAKTVPDVDPAIDSPPPGKTSPPTEDSPPKVQPK